MEKLKQIIKEKEYTLETLLLCTPFESDSDRDLLAHFNADVFFNGGFYAEPCMKKQIKLIDTEIAEKESSNNNLYYLREIETLQTKKKELESQLLSMKNFESLVRTCKFSDDIAYIRSFPGSGKTTYLHKLIYDNKGSHGNVIIDFKSFNSELMISGMDCKEIIFKTENVDIENTLIKFVFLLTDTLKFSYC